MIISTRIFNTWYFWLIATACALAAISISFIYFPQAIPMVDVTISMNRQQALSKAQELSTTYSWSPAHYMQATAFTLDDHVRNYVELEAGGKEAFKELLREKLYVPYTWRVRHFKENSAHETLIIFTPDGTAYGFQETFPEDMPGAMLSAQEARMLAEHQARDVWEINFEEYTLVESSQCEKPSKRIDHTFVYELTNKKIGEAYYRVHMHVSGDKFTALVHYIKVPEAFTRRYDELRAANNTIAATGSFVMRLLYLFFGCVVGLFFLMRKHWVIIYPALFWGFGIALLQTASGINEFPLQWFSYDTALSLNVFIVQQCAHLLYVLFFTAALYTISIMAAESLTRRAFGHQPQLWKAWSKPLVNSYTILGQTIGGYLMVALVIMYYILFSLVGSRLFGWWNPSGILSDPNILATYLPWFTPLARSLGAGFWEECLFRAVPLAGAALIGQRIGYRKSMIAFALIAQAIIFGAVHADYPALPSYVRLIEMIIPFSIFGGIYLAFGLLPVIIAHTVYDIVWFALPLFVSTAPGMWFNQFMVCALALIPLWILLYQRVKIGSWRTAPESAFNKAWRPSDLAKAWTDLPEEPFTYVKLSKKITTTILISGIVGIIVWALCTPFKHDAPKLPITRAQAIEKATQALQEQGISLSAPWRALATVESVPGASHRYVWQKIGHRAYDQLLGTYLSQPEWHIRFVQFEGDIVERAEEYTIFINPQNNVRRIQHQLPQSRPGKELSEPSARALAYTHIQELYHLDNQALQEISAVATKHPSRTDWLFTFEDSAVSKEHEPLKARLIIEIAGDSVTNSYRTVYIPEEWSRAERNYESIIEAINIILMLLLVLVSMFAAAVGLGRLGKHHFNKKIFFTIIGAWLLASLLQVINNWPLIIITFNTSESITLQTVMFILFALFKVFSRAVCIAFIFGYIYKKYSTTNFSGDTYRSVIGISLGICFSALSAFIVLVTNKITPFWLNSLAAATYIPTIGLRINDTLYYIMAVTIFLLIIMLLDYLTRNNYRIATIIILLFMGCIIVPLTVNISMTTWLLQSVATALLIYCSYTYVIRFDESLVPVIISVPFILTALQQAIINPCTGAMLNSLLFILVIATIAWLWSRHLYKHI